MESPRRHPRTLEEAFGPYERGSISEPYTPMQTADKIVLTASTIVGLGIIVAMLLGVI
jgi:hypothetical protein